MVDRVTDEFEASDLPARYKLAVRYADVLIIDPSSLSDELRAALLAEFTPAEIVELTLTVTMAMGFSKAAIAWGPPPELPLVEVATPTPDGSVA